MPRHLAGAILGPRGSTAARLRRESGAKVHLVKTPPGTPMQVCAAATLQRQQSGWHVASFMASLCKFPRSTSTFQSFQRFDCCSCPATCSQVLEIEGVYEQVARCVTLVFDFFAVEAPQEKVLGWCCESALAGRCAACVRNPRPVDCLGFATYTLTRCIWLYPGPTQPLCHFSPTLPATDRPSPRGVVPLPGPSHLHRPRNHRQEGRARAGRAGAHRRASRGGT